jgi:hypothetical protein
MPCSPRDVAIVLTSPRFVVKRAAVAFVLAEPRYGRPLW